jgi:hypothetical protein
MSNPTTPFGWQMPTATDLVTDLPADFEVFGQAVATSLGDLLGGSTGQVLSKASNADMDFVWSADAAGMTNPMTTNGDTIYGGASGAPTRLGIGSTGQVLTVASGIPSWASPASTSGLTQIASVSISSASAWNTGTVFSSTYTNYKILLYGEGTGTNDAIFCFPRSGTTNNSSGGCSYAMDGKCTDGNRIEMLNTGQNYFLFPYYGTPGNFYDLTISQPFATAKTFLVGNTLGTSNATASFGTVNHAGWTTQTTSYNGLGFTVSGGSFTGTMKIYGLAN